MKSYKASTGRELDKTVVYLAVAFGLAMIALGIFRRSVYAGLIGAMLILAVSFNKSISATEEGIVTEYTMPFIRKKDVWRWDEIVEIYCEYSPKQPSKIGLHFTKESLLARRLLFARNEAYEVIDMALAQNKNIRVSDDE